MEFQLQETPLFLELQQLSAHRIGLAAGRPGKPMLKSSHPDTVLFPDAETVDFQSGNGPFL